MSEIETQSIATKNTTNPYVGPVAFKEKDAGNFFGRDDEIRHLTSLIIAHRAVLLHAQSGAGKTSLLQAGVVPELRRRKRVRVLPISRVGGELPAEVDPSQVTNIFGFNLLLNLQSEAADVQLLPTMTLLDGLQPMMAQQPNERRLRPRLLILDQFEELFTTHTDRYTERADFFLQLQQALAEYPQLSLLLAMRDDYIARLDRYVVQLPDRLRTRFHMERLDVDGARAAVRHPAGEAGRPFAPGVAEKLVDNLRRIQDEQLEADLIEGEATERYDQYVEPVHLQIVCRDLWTETAGQAEIDIGDESFGNVDQALTKFYNGALQQVVDETNVSERQLRTWFSEQLITPAGTRGLLYRDTDSGTTAGLPNQAADLLRDAYIVRAVTRGSNTWYELAHDRLVQPVLEANRQQQTQLTLDAQRWSEQGRDTELLYQGLPLRELVQQLEETPGQFGQTERDFINASQDAERQRQEQRLSRRNRLLTYSLLLGIAIVVIASVSWLINQERLGYWGMPDILHAGPVISIAHSPAEPGSIYAITSQGSGIKDGAMLLRAQGESDEWEVVSTNLLHRSIADFVVANTEVSSRYYMSVRGQGMLRSDDGITWQEINTGLHSFNIRNIVVNPLNPEIVYASSDDKQGIFESRDGGNTWIDISGTTLFGIAIFSMAYTNYSNGALLVGTEDGRILSRTNGESPWQPEVTYPGTGTVIVIAVEPKQGKVIYAGTSTGHLFYSFDGGDSWQLLNKPPDIFSINSLAITPGQPKSVFMSSFGIGGNIIWHSDNAGRDWQPVEDNRFTREYVELIIHPDEPKTIYAAGSPGIMKTVDTGKSWRYFNINAPIANINRITISPIVGGPTYVGVAGSVFYKKSHERRTWQRSRNLPAVVVTSIAADRTDPDVAYVGVYLPNKWSIFKTVNGGESWQPTKPVPQIPEKSFNQITSLKAAEDNGEEIVYAGSYGCGVIHSSDRGETWSAFGQQSCPKKFDQPRRVINLSVAAGSIDKLYVSADNRYVYVSENRGKDWHVVELPISGSIHQMEADPAIKERIYVITNTEGFLRSDDGGQTWQTVFNPFKEKLLAYFTIDEKNPGTLYIVSRDGNIWKSIDAGENWRSLRDNPLINHATVLAYDENRQELVIGTVDSGIYYLKEGTYFR